MLSTRGPRRWAITLASTSTPSTAGLPTLTSLPSVNSRTRPSFTDDPGSAAMRSTRIWSPGATRYCLPPLTMTADSELSGLGTARDCTKGGHPNLSRPFATYAEGKGGHTNVSRPLPTCGEGKGGAAGLSHEDRGHDDEREHQPGERRHSTRIQCPDTGGPAPTGQSAQSDHDRGDQERDAGEAQESRKVVARRRHEQRGEQPTV